MAMPNQKIVQRLDGELFITEMTCVPIKTELINRG